MALLGCYSNTEKIIIILNEDSILWNCSCDSKWSPKKISGKIPRKKSRSNTKFTSFLLHCTTKTYIILKHFREGINRMFQYISALFNNIFNTTSYQSELEKYISNRFPENHGDIERMEREFNLTQINRRFPCNLN